MERKLRSDLDANGHEIPDSRPMSLPVGFRRPPTIQEMVRNYVRFEVSRVAANEGEESFEEADDFVVGDEPELHSPYELDDEQANASMKEFVEEQPVPKADPQPEPPAPHAGGDKGKKRPPAKSGKGQAPKPVPDPATESTDDED